MHADTSLINVDFVDRQLWSRILSEAEKASVQDIFMAPILMTCIKDARDLPGAIIGRIAGLLSSPQPSASLHTALHALLDEDTRILSAAAFDLVAVLERDPATTRALHVVLHAKGFLALQTHRFANALWKSGRTEFALYLQGCASRVFQVDIHPAARLGVGIFLDHATGIVIGETSIVEDNVSILQNVTLGGTGKETGERHPKVRSGVLIGAGASILGKIEIGANARIGAGSVVLKPVTRGTTVAGVPARVVRQDRSSEPSRTMDQVFDEGKPLYDVGL
ncbi:serine O-acetyltransferase [Rhizobium hainanense]|uniref:Serine acetyltransferase n=1 Tax=Rhizobium hainanense TaxID=52131 RepID=A0A1C3W7V0_9HYPH|nr:serine O-acetyltransferase [Rhizobium hainanense]SCB36139.1 serine O-acetyltransferase [Rhizobium hainanense]